jgi:membrane fusion protein, multidrug efflux system
MRMLLRLLVASLAVLLVLAIVRHFTGVGPGGKPRSQTIAVAPPAAGLAVASAEVQKVSWQPFLGTVGSVTAIRGVTVSTELPGIVEKIAFESGAQVKAGDLLVQLDVAQEQAALVQATAKRDLDKINLERYRNLLARHTVPQSQYDSAEADFRKSQGSVDEQNAIIGKKTIRAPFDGVVGIRQVNLGQFLGVGQAIATLQSFDPIYVNFQIPQESLSAAEAGGQVEINVDAFPDRAFAGAITAVDSQVDQNSRNVEIQATLPNPRGELRPGMYAKVNIANGAVRNVTAIPVAAVNYAPYGDSVFVVSKLTDQAGREFPGVKQQFVKLGQARGDMVEVQSGVHPGDRVVTSDVFRLRSGQAIKVSENNAPPTTAASPSHG